MSKPTLVFLHGFLGSANDWSALIEQLPDYDCIAFDLPGHGDAREQRLNRMADFPSGLISNYSNEISQIIICSVTHSAGDWRYSLPPHNRLVYKVYCWKMHTRFKLGRNEKYEPVLMPAGRDFIASH